MINQNTKETRLLLLTAAGFSQGFLTYESQSLSTRFLNELLIVRESFAKYITILCEEINNLSDDKPKLFSIQKLCYKIYGLLKEAEIDNLNFEHIIYGLECLVEKNDHKKETFRLTKLERTIQELISKNIEEKLRWTELYAIKSFILDVVGLFQKDDNDDVIERFKQHLNNSYTTRHFTLNYDDLFVTNLEIASFSYGPTYRFKHLNNENIESYFLHGSIYFWRASECLGVGNKEDASNNRKGLQENKAQSYFNAIAGTTDKNFYDPLIIGISKRAKLENNTYKEMFDQFQTSINEVDELMILGYSFNDDHINEVLKKINNACLSKITVVDKKEVSNSAKFEKSVKSYLTSDSIKIEFHFNGVSDFIDKWMAR